MNSWDLRDLEKRLKEAYTTAYNEMKAEMQEIAAKWNYGAYQTPAQQLAAANKYDRLNKLCSQCAEVLQDTNRTAEKMINREMVNIFRDAYNSQAKELGLALVDNTAVRSILTGEVNPFTLVSFAGSVDKSVLQRELTSQLTTSILKGESIPHMAKRLQTAASGHLSNAVRVARTECTRVQNSATQYICEQGEKKGFDMWKRWYATNDERTRDEHTAVDGMEVRQNECFVVGGEELMYPGDVSHGASGWNVINCRCRCVAFINEDKDRESGNMAGHNISRTHYANK